MPDLTVIEGGGKSRDYDDGWSRHHFHSRIIELLRSVARGRSSKCRHILVQEINRLVENRKRGYRR